LLKIVSFRKNYMQYKAEIIINKDEHGYFAYCPALPGCVTQGESYEEAILHAREAVSLYLSTMSEEEIKAALSQEIVTTSIDIAVA
jgi:predicted RNase H-like HicB family nuclease